MPRLPQVSGRTLIQLLHSLGYETLRQRGSHVRLRKVTAIGEHNITVPDHPVLAKGTLNDILTRVALWNGIPERQIAGTPAVEGRDPWRRAAAGSRNTVRDTQAVLYSSCLAQSSVSDCAFCAFFAGGRSCVLVDEWSKKGRVTRRHLCAAPCRWPRVRCWLPRSVADLRAAL